MSEAIKIGFMLFGLIILLNGFAGGAVAALNYWVGMTNRVRRALYGAAITGTAFLIPLSGFLIASPPRAGGAVLDAVALVAIVIIVIVVACVISLPGAFIMSRKIAKADPLGDTFR